MEHARAGREDSEREGPAEEGGDVFRDPMLESVRVGGDPGVERSLGAELLLRDRAKRRERHGLLEQLVERGLAELARGPVDRGGGLGDRRERIDHGDRLGEDVSHGVRRGGGRFPPGGRAERRPRRARRARLRRRAPERSIARQESVRRGEEAFRVGGRPAQEGDRAGLERIRRERRDEGDLVVVRGQDAARLRGLVEQVDLRGREAALLEHGLHVAAEERRRLDEADGEARGLRHAAPPAGAAAEESGEPREGRRRGVRHEEARESVLAQPPDQGEGRREEQEVEPSDGAT